LAACHGQLPGLPEELMNISAIVLTVSPMTLAMPRIA
jgi:hypothetical protein